MVVDASGFLLNECFFTLQSFSANKNAALPRDSFGFSALRICLVSVVLCLAAIN